MPDQEWVGAGNQRHAGYDFFLSTIRCIFIQTLHNATVRHVAVTGRTGLGEDVEAA